MEVLMPIYLGLVSRVCGTKFKYAGLLLYPLPYVLALQTDSSFLTMLMIFTWVFLWKLTGHADGFKDYQRDNFLTPIAKLFKVDRMSTLYDAIFFALKGGLIGLLPAIMTGNIYLFIFSLIGYPLAYYLGFNVFNKTNNQTAHVNEIGAGLIAGLGFWFF